MEDDCRPKTASIVPTIDSAAEPLETVAKNETAPSQSIKLKVREEKNGVYNYAIVGLSKSPIFLRRKIDCKRFIVA